MVGISKALTHIPCAWSYASVTGDCSGVSLPQLRTRLLRR